MCDLICSQLPVRNEFNWLLSKVGKQWEIRPRLPKSQKYHQGEKSVNVRSSFFLCMRFKEAMRGNMLSPQMLEHRDIPKGEAVTHSEFLRRNSLCANDRNVYGCLLWFLVKTTYRFSEAIVSDYILHNLKEFWYLGKELQSFTLLGTIWEQEGKKHVYPLKITYINKSTFVLNSSAEWWCLSEFLF